MFKFFACALALLLTNLYAQSQEKQAVILYINGNYSNMDYNLGVLSEIERLKIPIDSIVATGWGAFAGALWSAGWSAGQIKDLVKSWDTLQHPKQPQKIALWHRNWFVKHSEDGTPSLESVAQIKPYFGKEFSDLQVQEAYWRSDVGSKIPFLELDSASSYPFPPLSAPESAIRIFSNPIALRDTNGTAAERYQQKLWNEDSTLIMIRPHSKPKADSLFRAGVQAVQNKRSLFPMPAAQDSVQGEMQPEPARFLYHPVFDSVPAELQGHLESFWNKKDTGSLAIKNFLEALQKDGSYHSVKLTMDTSSFLQINAENSSILSFSLQGIGGSFLGANAAANASFSFLSQFDYDLDLNAFYGQGIKGLVPKLRFGRFFMGDGSFFAKLNFLELSPTSYFQKGIEIDSRILNEKSSGFALGVEKPLGTKNNAPVLTIAVEMEDKEITSGASRDTVYNDPWDFDHNYFDPDNWDWPDFPEVSYEYEETSLSSMFLFAKWLWQSEDYDRWFSTEGFMAELMGGFKAVSVRSVGQAPLYVSTQGKINITHPLSKNFSLMAGAEFGANFRKTGQNTFVLRAPLSEIDGYNRDPALDNRYRFAMGMGLSQEQWQSPVNASNLYGLLASGIALHINGNGLFLAAGFAKDGEPNPWAPELSQKRLFAEPKIRIRTSVFDFIAGQSMVYFSGAEEKNSFFFEFRGMIP
jgi:NTE family protein